MGPSADSPRSSTSRTTTLPSTESRNPHRGGREAVTLHPRLAAGRQGQRHRLQRAHPRPPPRPRLLAPGRRLRPQERDGPTRPRPDPNHPEIPPRPPRRRPAQPRRTQPNHPATRVSRGSVEVSKPSDCAIATARVNPSGPPCRAARGSLVGTWWKTPSKTNRPKQSCSHTCQGCSRRIRRSRDTQTSRPNPRRTTSSMCPYLSGTPMFCTVAPR